MVSITLIGIGVASTLGALTKFNSVAAISRNATGACAAVMNQIDLIQSNGPFNPQKRLSFRQSVQRELIVISPDSVTGRGSEAKTRHVTFGGLARLLLLSLP